MSVHSYQGLVVWQKSMQLVIEIYTLTQAFPVDERFGLVSQMRRCCISIPSNIAEGSRRGSKKDFRNFLLYAYGSGAELETQLLICKRLGYTSDEQFHQTFSLLSEVMKMLNSLISKLKS